jgi:23S rRNA (cytidine1920-2'-O)/16S rRNA (cytidine1409-2'-O)-methyltransferase
LPVRRRLDAELVRRGLVTSRTAAQEAIAANRVLVNGAVAEKPARLVATGDAVILAGPPPRFVGRGGEKLDAALHRFGIDVDGRRVLDVGASTGGFTDALLARGAREVVALDVGYGQLHPRLRSDPRVTVLERTNIRWATTATIGGPVDAIVADLSFISLTKVIATLVTLCHPGSPMVLLVKPQFEAGRDEVGRGRGVITDPQIHNRVRGEVGVALEAAGCRVVAWVESPILGSEGNREFLVHAVTGEGGA